MYNFLLQIIIMASLAAMVYIIARAMPRISSLAAPVEKKNYLEEFFKKIPWHKIDAFLSLAAEKFLRRLKITILKFDNSISKHLSKFKITNGKGKEILKPETLLNETPPANIENKSENNTIEGEQKG